MTLLTAFNGLEIEEVSIVAKNCRIRFKNSDKTLTIQGRNLEFVEAMVSEAGKYYTVIQ